MHWPPKENRAGTEKPFAVDFLIGLCWVFLWRENSVVALLLSFRLAPYSIRNNVNAPEIRNPALECDILVAVKNLQRDMVNLAMSLVRFPSLNGDGTGLALCMARWCSVEKTR